MCLSLIHILSRWKQGAEKDSLYQHARQGLQFLLNHFWDSRFGGFYWKVSRQGDPIDLSLIHILLQKLRGMYAFVIWDRNENKLFGARDIFGIKPFYYYKKNGTFLFGSEIKGFLPHPHFEKAVNMKRLPEYLSFEYLPCEETMFKDVYKLLGGHCFTYENGRLNIEQYYQIEYKIDESKPLEYWIDTIEKTFQDSTLTHKISDVEVGSFLSSGIDSSYVACEMSKNNKVKACLLYTSRCV